MRVKRPPAISEINELQFVQAFSKLTDLPENVFELNVNSDGRYSTYYEISHKYPKHAEAIWTVLKVFRKGELITLPMRDQEGNHAKILQTYQIGKIISLVDRVTTHSAIQDILSGLFSDPRLLSDLFNEEPISSSQLEGAATTTKVALEMLDNGREPANESEMMIARNRDMMMYVRDPEILQHDLSRVMIQSVHEIATRGIDDSHYHPGVMRDNNNISVQDVRTGEVIYQPPDFGELERRVDELCEWVNIPHHTYDGKAYIHPLVKACVLHFMIGWLHPFHDGNGRTARGLFYWVMMKYGYTGFEYLSISKYLKKSAVAYATAYLNSEYDQFDLTYFIDYCLKQVSLAIKEFTGYISEQKKMFDYLTSGFVGSERFEKLNERQRKIVISGLMRGGRRFSAGTVSKMFDVVFNTAKNDLEIISANKFFKKLSVSNSKVYFSPKSLRQLEEWQQPEEAANRPKATDW